MKKKQIKIEDLKELTPELSNQDIKEVKGGFVVIDDLDGL